MSTVTTYNGANPYGAMSKMAQVNIDSTTQDTLNIAVLDKTDKYTIRFWCKSSVNTTVTVMCGSNQVRTYTLDGDWAECLATFNGSVGEQVNFIFNARGQFLIWHPKLEIGTVATDFSDSTISLRSAILQTAEQIEAKVSKEGGTKQSFSWKLDAEGFYLYSNNQEVFRCNSQGASILKLSVGGGYIGNDNGIATLGGGAGESKLQVGSRSGNLDILLDPGDGGLVEIANTSGLRCSSKMYGTSDPETGTFGVDVQNGCVYFKLVD